MARYGAEVVGVVEYPQVFQRHPNPPGPPAPLSALFSAQDEVHDRVLGQIARASPSDQQLLWDALRKELAQGFGTVHRGKPPPAAAPDVFYHRFVAH